MPMFIRLLLSIWATHYYISNLTRSIQTCVFFTSLRVRLERAAYLEDGRSVDSFQPAVVFPGCRMLQIYYTVVWQLPQLSCPQQNHRMYFITAGPWDLSGFSLCNFLSTVLYSSNCTVHSEYRLICCNIMSNIPPHVRKRFGSGHIGLQLFLYWSQSCHMIRFL